MNRRQFIEITSTAVAGAVARSAAGNTIPVESSSGRPNFLFMIADDLTFRTIHSVNNPEVKTPNLDRLVARGCYFEKCFHQGSWSGAVCVPSRTMLNTGLSAFRARNADANQGYQIPLWGQTLRSAGYRTYITGKWHLDAVGLQRSFSDMGPVGPGYLASTDDMYDRPAPGNTWSPTNREARGHWLKDSLWLSPRNSRTQHSSELYADAAVAHLQAVAESKEPFFMYVGFNAPHDPRQAPKSFLSLYPEDKILVPPNYLPSHPFDQGMRLVRDELLAPFPRTEEAVRLHRREYYAIITHLDSQVGRILDALDASGKASNTYVIFTADHGLAVGEHGLMGKQNQYECSMRMPLIVAGPSVPAGKRVSSMVYQHSLYATTCELAGLPTPPHVEFPSLAQLLRHGAEKPLHDAMFGWLTDVQRSVRTNQFKLIYSAPAKRYQLFDLEKDPWEMKDLSENSAFAGKKQELYDRLKSLQKQLGDNMVLEPLSDPALQSSNLPDLSFVQNGDSDASSALL